MFRLTQLTTQNLKTAQVFNKTAWLKPKISPWTTHMSIFTPRTFYSTKEDDIETIDPKDYPELYPDEKEEEIDTEWFVDSDYKASETDFIPLWQRRAVGEHLEDRLALQKVSQELMATGILTAENIKDLLIESKLESVEVLDVRNKCDWADYMIVASSSKGEKYLTSVADHVGQVVKKSLEKKPYVEGKHDDSGWVLIDLGRIIVHLFTPEVRERYDLEGLWNSVPSITESEQQ
ncbi:hypothetical protein BY458DRAFT_510807 [Sporodiniella umbellata]|nr:hypothetical protein BY458DRAFT_510807 [Sporodiniella umbellata]